MAFRLLITLIFLAIMPMVSGDDLLVLPFASVDLDGNQGVGTTVVIPSPSPIAEPSITCVRGENGFELYQAELRNYGGIKDFGKWKVFRFFGGGVMHVRGGKTLGVVSGGFGVSRKKLFCDFSTYQTKDSKSHVIRFGARITLR